MLEKIRGAIATRIVQELTAETYYRFHRAFSPGMQEYVEARLLLSYCADKKLATLAALDEEFREACSGSEFKFTIDCSDYVLGVADLTGELMRKAIAQGGAQGIQLLTDLCSIESCMLSLTTAHSVGKDMPSKMRVLHQSVAKVQKRCYDHAIRTAERVDCITVGETQKDGENANQSTEPPQKKSKHALESV